MDPRFDDFLNTIITEKGQGIYGFLDVLFSFLYRRTDFFYEMVPGENMGFFPGQAQTMINGYFKKYQELHYKEKVDVHRNKMVKSLIYIPVFVFLVILVMLVSGIFTHKLIAIGSNSMSPIYERGDAVIYKKIDAKDLMVGEIIAFKKSERIVTHRIVKITKRGNSYIINTKGDANNAPDAWEVKDSEVLGVVNYSIKYIGYPTLWFNDIYTGKETS